MSGVGPRQILTNMSLLRIPPGHPWHGGRPFVIGCLDGYRITLLSQQTRALNLVYAMAAERIVERGTKVVVLGAGAAGLTAAEALLEIDCDVRVLERSDRELGVFHPSSATVGRHVRPFLGEWPALHWFEPESGLPIGNWKAGSSVEVADQLRLSLPRALKTVVVEARTAVSFNGNRWHVAYQGSSGEQVEWDPKVLIIAVGFGADSRRGDKDRAIAATPSYWTALPTRSVDQDVWIGGDGDGALTDLISFAFQGRSRNLDPYEHALTGVADWMKKDASSPTLALLAALEESNDKGQLSAAQLDDRYSEMERNPALKESLRQLDICLGIDSQSVPRVHQLSRSPWRFAPGCFGVNRLLFWRALTSHRVKRHLGSLSAERDTLPRRSNGALTYARYGPKPREFESSFEDLVEAATVLTYQNALDLTRKKAWPDGFFPSGMRPTQTRPHTNIEIDMVIATTQIKVDPRTNLTTSTYIVEFVFSERSSADGLLSTLAMEHNVTPAEPFRLRMIGPLPSEVTLQQKTAPWTVAYAIQPKGAVTVRLEGDPDGAAWMADAAGFPVYANMHIKKIEINVLVDEGWQFDGLEEQRSLMLRRDYSEVTASPVLTSNGARNSSYRATFVSEENQQWLKQGYFYGVRWRRLSRDA